jgi:hypothetical protein
MGRISRSMAYSKVLKPQHREFDPPSHTADFPRRFTCGFSVHAAADGGRIGQVIIAAADNSASGVSTYSIAPAVGDVILEGALQF